MKQTKRQKVLLYALPLSILGIGAISAPAISLFNKDVVLFILLFDMTLVLLTYMVLKSRRKNY